MVAARYTRVGSSEAVVKLLIDAGANLDLKTKDGNTALILSVINAGTDSSDEAVKLLIDAKANLDLRNNNGSVALKVATVTKNYAIVNYLLTNGADDSIPDNLCKTALMYAWEKNHFYIYYLLDSRPSALAG